MKCTTLQLSLPSTNNNKKSNNKHTSFMARFTAQGSVNLVINGERLCFAFEFKDPFLNHKRRSKIRDHACTKICSLGNKSSNGYSVDERLGGSNKDSKDDFDYDDDNHNDAVGEFARDELSCFRGLVLDISYRPVNVVCWKRAICLEFMEKADVLEYYDQTVNSPSGSFYIPAVLRITTLLQVVKRRRVKQTLSRKSIFFRDSFMCQYCSSRESLTVDHVRPIARGGEWTWENLVTACARCNSRKGPKTLEEANMKLLKVPKAPKETDILAIPLTNAAIRSMKKRSSLPDEWRQYLGLPPSE